MKNVNKDYLVEVNVKTAEIKAPKDMKFHITDIYTCNIFFKLIFNEPKRTTNKLSISDYLNKDYMPKERAVEYTLKLRILRPNGEPIDEDLIDVKLLDSSEEFLYADLAPDFLNMIGFYECELFIDARVVDADGSERSERNTTDSFQFEVVKSIFTDLSDAMEEDPDYPLLADMYATKEYVLSETKSYVDYAIGNLDASGYATLDYVNNLALNKIDIDLSDYVKGKDLENIFSSGGINLEGFVTNEAFNGALETINSNLSSYATMSYVDDKIAEVVLPGGTITLSGYVKHEELEQKLERKSNVGHKHDDVHVTWTYMYQENFARVSQIPETLPANGGYADECGTADYAISAKTSEDSNKVCGYRVYVLTQGEFDFLVADSKVDKDTLYFIKEEEE